MTIDNTAMDVIISTVTAVVQEPTISTITATVQDNIVQIPFDVISQIRDFYEICWSKLMIFISAIGAISILILGYIVPKIQEKKFKELLLEQKNLFEEQIDKQKKDFEDKIKKLEEFSYEDNARLFRNTAVLLEIYDKSVDKEDRMRQVFNLLCAAIESFSKLEDSLYKEDNLKYMDTMIKFFNGKLREDNKNIIDKNRLKKIIHILKDLDKTKISADLENNIEKIIKFYDTL